MFSVDNAYKLSNVRITGYICKTNLPSNTAFRGFGGPQGMFIIESIITHLAENSQLDATQVYNFIVYCNKNYYNNLIPSQHHIIISSMMA